MKYGRSNSRCKKHRHPEGSIDNAYIHARTMPASTALNVTPLNESRSFLDGMRIAGLIKYLVFSFLATLLLERNSSKTKFWGSYVNSVLDVVISFENDWFLVKGTVKMISLIGEEVISNPWLGSEECIEIGSLKNVMQKRTVSPSQCILKKLTL